jgi:prepilin-type N-terminal cleavage/methylation domain-containing protein
MGAGVCWSRGSRSAAPGFTLIEITLAIVLLGVVSLLAYGAIATATATQDRLAEGRTALQAEVAWRTLLTDAIRAARDPFDYGGPTVAVQDGAVDRDGRPLDRFAVITAGGPPPLNDGADWQLTLGIVEGGLGLEAVPVGRSAPARLLRGPPGYTGMQVEALTGTGMWSETWTSDRALPYAVRITFWGPDGPAGPPLVVGIPTAGQR